MRPFFDQYADLLAELLGPLSSHVDVNARTGQETKVLPGGCSVLMDLSDGVLPTAGIRRTYPRTSAAECAWFLSGEQDVSWLRSKAPIWNAFVEADGDTVKNAYGHRWRTHFKRDQVAKAIVALAHDPSDRRVYVSAWDPAQDGLGEPAKSVPCPLGFQLAIYGGAIHMHVPMRSLDVFVGLPYDVMTFSYLLAAFSSSLRVDLGTLRVTAGHAHLYKSHYEMAEECLGQLIVAPNHQLPGWTVGEVTGMPDAYVQAAEQEQKTHEWPAYSPKPEVHV